MATDTHTRTHTRTHTHTHAFLLPVFCGDNCVNPQCQGQAFLLPVFCGDNSVNPQCQGQAFLLPVFCGACGAARASAQGCTHTWPPARGHRHRPGTPRPFGPCLLQLVVELSVSLNPLALSCLFCRSRQMRPFITKHIGFTKVPSVS